MAWKDIPEKKVLATLKDGKTFKGVAAEKMTIYVDGAVPGGDGDVQGISVTVDPSTYVMTTQLKDGKGGNVGDPATVDLPLESMVVSGEYDDATKSVILTLKNGETVSFSVADLVSGLQAEITSENPLSADLIEETTNKNFVTEQEKEDIDDIQNIRDSITDIESSLDGKQDTIDENNPLNADFIDDENSDKKLVTPEEKENIEDIPNLQNDINNVAGIVDELELEFGEARTLTEDDYNWNSEAHSATEPYDSIAPWLLAPGIYYVPRETYITISRDSEKSWATEFRGSTVIIANGDVQNTSPSAIVMNYQGVCSKLWWASNGVLQNNFTSGTFLTKSDIHNGLNSSSTERALAANQGKVLNEKIGDLSSLDTTEKSNLVGAINEIVGGGSGGNGELHTITSDDINDGEYVDLWELGPGIYNCDPEASYDVPLKIAHRSTGEVENVMTNAFGVWLVTGFSSYNTIYYFPAEDQSGQNTNYPVKYTIVEGDVVEKFVISGGSGVQNTLYINPSDLYFGTLSNGINIYSDSGMTQTVHSSVIDEMLDAGDIRVKLVDPSDPSGPENKDGVVMGKYWDGDPAVFAYVMLLPFWSASTSSSNGLTIYYMYEPNNDYKFYSFGSNLIASTSDVENIANLKIGEMILSGSVPPTNRTVGTKGQLYKDTSNGKLYICTNRSGSTYTWKEIIKNGDNISTLTNDAGYQNASQVSSAIASAVGEITSFEYQVVQTLPVTGEKGVIYLVANSGTTPNIYDEYIWVNNAFEKIGTTDIDLSGYATTQDLEDGLAGKVDAIDPTYLPDGAEQGGIIYVTDHTEIDPDSIADGQIIFDQNDHILYIAEVTVDAETGENIVTWHEIQTEKEVIYVNVTVTDVQAMTFTVSGYTANDICVLLDAGVNVFYRLNLTQSLPGLAAGIYDFRPIMHASSGGYGGVMSSMIGPSGNNTILGIASHVDSGTSHFEMRQLANASDIPEDMVILDYGTSTWNDFLTAYNDNRIVYCRASSGTDPGVGTKTRLAFMAYVNSDTNPTEVEFQYLRSVSNKSASSQCDQVFVYKLTSAGAWTVTTRNTMVKIAAGTNMTSSYAGGVLTLSADLSSKQDVIDSTHKLSADLIDSSTSDDKTYQTGTGAPTTSTEGSVGEMYVDKSTGTVYVCTDTTGGTYTWNEVSGGGDGVTELTTDDYDYHASGSTDDGVALWRLEPGVYYTGSGVQAYVSESRFANSPRMYLIGPSFGSGNNAKNITELTAVPTGVSLVTYSVSSSGVLIATKSMPADVPVITMTSTDPGEGSALAENHFIAVYEV